MTTDGNPYYTAYENRYQSAYAAGAERWGHSPDDADLTAVLTRWVIDHQLAGRRVLEFACGEGASGVILSRLGCLYHGVDIAPAAVEKTREALKDFPDAKVTLLDMVNQSVDLSEGLYDAALDVMGLHMLVTDADRSGYLNHAYACLKNGAPMLFFRECYRADAYEGPIADFNDWLARFPGDYTTPQQRFVRQDGKDIEVYVPLLPARAHSRDGYQREMAAIGFIVDEVRELPENQEIITAASIYSHKPHA